MKVETRVALGSSAFLILVFVVYLAWSHEATGSACLLFSGLAYALLGGYAYLQIRKRHGIARPEDTLDATQADGAGEIGFFPGASMWPAGLGLGAICFGLAMVFGTWYWLFGGILLFGGLIGFVTESEVREEGPDDPGTTHPSASIPPTTPEERTAEVARWGEHISAAE